MEECNNCYFKDKLPKIYWSQVKCVNFESKKDSKCKNFKKRGE
jgi:uncharacterized cysteine cluster protein YcgN (CxxCxxCC family)